jgi:hypothetical protein
MRAFVLLFLFAMCVCAIGQQNPGNNSSALVRPDAYIRVSQDASGSNVLEVTMLDRNYPAELLQRQLAQIGKEVGSQTRIILVERHNPMTGKKENGELRVTAAVPNLIDRAKGILGLQALARAFAGAPAPNTVDGLMVQYETEQPTEKIINKWNSDSVRVVGQASPGTGIEYRITLLSQDPTQIVIPEGRAGENVPKPPVPPAPSSSPNWIILTIFIIAALALGALVYSLLLRPGSRGNSQ